MKLRASLLLVAALSLLTRLPLRADDAKGVTGQADQFQAEIKKLGGYVHRDKRAASEWSRPTSRCA
jgi:hypothetical protein